MAGDRLFVGGQFSRVGGVDLTAGGRRRHHGCGGPGCGLRLRGKAERRQQPHPAHGCARKRAVQVRVGRRRRADPANPRAPRQPGASAGARRDHDPNGPRHAAEGPRASIPASSRSSGCRCPPAETALRVVELLATGTSGGAQEHVSTWSPGSIRCATTYPCCRCRTGPPSAGSSRRASRSASSTTCRRRGDRGGRRAPRGRQGGRRPQPHVPRRGHRHAGGVVARRDGPPPAAGRRDGPLVSRVRSDEDRELVRRLTPKMDHLIAVSRAIVRKIEDEGRVGAPISLIYNGVDLDPLRPSPRSCCTLQRRVPDRAGRAARRGRRAARAGEGPPDAARGVARVLAAVPDAHLLIVGEGSRREALEAQARRSGCGSAALRSVTSPAAATTSRPSPPPSTSPCCRATARRRASRSSRPWRSRARSSPPPSAGSPR